MKRKRSLRNKPMAQRRKPAVAKQLGRSAASKKPLRDKAHRQRVNGLPCLVCRFPPPSEAHHVREALPRTMGVRVGDDKVVPLCEGHHSILHSRSRKFWSEMAIDPLPIAAKLYAETIRLRERSHPQ